MITPQEALQKCRQNFKAEWKVAFVAAAVTGLLVHLPIMASDIPNHDGLSSMYFDQNMITSGRWFLTIACGISSYFTLPWIIGLLAIFFLACTAVALTELLELHDSLLIVAVSGLLVVFPAIASTFAYVFTMDGYMLALLLAVLSVLFTAKWRKGFLAGGVCLAFSMGIYQAYLPFAVLLCIYQVILVLIEQEGIKNKLLRSLNYLYMGGIGVVLYYVILQLLLKIQGKELAAYQGISGMGGGDAGGSVSLQTLVDIWRDFFVFTLKGNVFFNNVFSLAGILILTLLAAVTLLRLAAWRKWWKNPGFFVIMGLLALGVPVAANLILLVSPNVTYHLLMRYQWVMLPILLLAFINRYAACNRESYGGLERQAVSGQKKGAWGEWALVLSAFVLIFNYAVTDHIGYSNLEKRYEKTYAYCVRLLDRIEQTEGYYQGIPIAMVGIVGDDEFPVTDITEKVTGGMIGVSGDVLVYMADNYQAFMKNYLGATLNFLDVEATGQIYFDEEYIAMDTFPAANSVKVVNGIMYVKTENVGRD